MLSSSSKSVSAFLSLLVSPVSRRIYFLDTDAMHVQSASFNVCVTPPPATARQGEQVIFLYLEGGLYRQPLEAPLSAVAHHGENCSCTEDRVN